MRNMMRFSKILLATTALVAVGSLALRAQAQTLPTGGSVASGQVAIGAPNAGRMAITQGSQNAIVNWQGFSIGQGGRVDITQPNSSAAMLNRVTGQAPSTIAGQLNANGRVYLVNPNGIAITQSGVVNTGSFVASTLGISDSDFLSGRLRFQGNGASAAVSNAGRIQAGPGGYAALLGGAVENSGTISVPMGRIGLGSGERVTLDLSGDGFLQVAVPTAAGGDQALVSNSGRLSAPGGRVEITAATAQSAARHAINMSGVVEANTVSGTAGSITFSGGPGGAVNVSGRVDASSATGRGGNVTVTGANIALRGAEVNASGATGGGRVRIGGDRLGQGDLPRAQRVSVDNASVIRADATRRGDGGDIVLWSEGRTDFAGRISARGGAEGGRGGEAEVSSRGVLNYTGWTDLRAPLGAWGTLLLDPYNITISNDTQTTGAGFTATTDNSVINAGTLVTALGGANVTVSTGLAGSAGTQAGNITLAVPLTWSSASNLTLQAAGQITLNGAVTATAGGLTLQAGSSSTISANQAISVGRFELLSGNWVQNTATLPSFAATDFRITGGSFLRAAGGDGSTTTPYSLTDIYGVQGMGSSSTFLGNSYQLANDIAAAGTSGWHGGAGFVPVGTNAARFTGRLDGAGYVINGLTINRQTMDGVGLIGYADSGSSISNLGLVGGSVTGNAAVGGLVGDNRGNITQSYATGAVTGNIAVGGLVGGNAAGGSIEQSYATGAVVGSGLYVGGLVGVNGGTITQAYATGAVAGNVNEVGGLVGNNQGSITHSYATGAVTGTGDLVGGLVGINYVSITQVYATGAVTGTTRVGGLVGFNAAQSTITQAYATGAVTGSGNLVGGLVGFNAAQSTITQAYAAGAVTGRDLVGGLVGRNQGGITQAYAAGAVTGRDLVGGLVGENATGSITQAYATGAVTGSSSVGGLVGFSAVGSSITQAYATGRVVGSNRVGGLVGLNDGTISQSYWDTETTGQGGSAGGDPLNTTQARTQAGYVGWDFGSVWYQAGDMRPILRSEAATAVNGVITISNLNQLQLMNINLAGNYRLAGNIDASASNATENSPGIWGSGGFVPVGTDAARFTGSLDGAGNVITGLRIDRPTMNDVGLIGVAGSGSSISNLGLVGGSVTGGLAVGGLVGQNFGTITQAYVTGAVTGLENVGGLVGQNFGTITQAYAAGAVTGNITSGAGRVGGLVGRNFGTITQAYATGTVTSTFRGGGLVGWNDGTITQSYAAVSFPGTIYRAGLVFIITNSSITASYWDTDISGWLSGTGSGNISGLTGLTTAQMQDITSFRTTYAGWDFATVWSPPNQVGQNNASATAYYPQLYSLSPAAAVTTSLSFSSREYGDSNPTASFTTAGLRAGDTVITQASVIGLPAANANVGTYQVGGTGAVLNTPSGTSYRMIYVPAPLAVTPRLITVTPDSGQSREYGDANPTLTYTTVRTGGSAPGLVTGDSLNGALASVATSTDGIGNYAINQGNLANSNYTITFTSGRTMAVTPRLITVTPNSGQSREYGDANPTLTYTTVRTGGSAPGLVTGDSLNGALASVADGTSNIGDYAINQGNLANSNYTISFTSGRTMAVTPRLITVTPDNGQGREYGDANPVLGYGLTRTTAGAAGTALVNGNALTGALASAADGTSNVGAYAINQGDLAASSNYTLAFTSGRTMAVTPRLITVTPNSGQGREYGDANPTLGYGLTRTTAGAAGTALVNGNTLSGALASAADGTSNVGAYAITQGDLAASSNYTLAFTSGRTMAVTPRLITVTPDNGQGRDYGDANPVRVSGLTRTTPAAALRGW
ncbi:MAG: MBG domain-containing protein [Alphaproteobacteria bacterium]